MSMAKIAKSLSLNLEAKAYDILYDISQEVDMSVTAMIEGIAYTVQSLNKKERTQFLMLVKSIQEPGN